MKRFCLPFWLLLATALVVTGNSARAAEFAFGADLSFLKQAEDGGTVFKDGTNAQPGLQIFCRHGYNWVRLRIFVDPVTDHLPNNLAYTLALAKDVKKSGAKLLLDFHYANSWADPGKQPMPVTWEPLSHTQRVQTVFTYTCDTVAAFRQAGVLPDMVQVGNEITHGMLWPAGKLPEHWDQFADYVRAGVQGVAAGAGDGPGPRIMIHCDQGANTPRTKYFFDHLNQYGIAYDVIGFSYYPWWHGSLADLRENLAFAAKTYHKDVMVVETAYYWKPSRYFEKTPPPFAESPAGQREFLDELTRVVMNVPDSRGTGVFWWEPAVASRGLAARGFFDEAGNALPVLTVFDKYTRPERPTADN